MVLQCGIENNIWGKAKANEKVTVTIAKHTVTAVADSKGNWSLSLPSMKAQNQPLSLKVSSTNKLIKVNNILIGEVWVCSGQSNMEWTMDQIKDQKHNAENMSKANYPTIRQFMMPNTVSAEKELKSYSGHWVACSPQSIGKYTAAGFYFARKLQKELNVSIGLIEVAWGGTPVESWIRRPIMMSNLKDASYVKLWQANDSKYDLKAEQAKFKPLHAKWLKELTEARKNNKPIPRFPGPPPQQPRESPYYPSTLYNAMIAPILPYRIKGVIWYQGESNLGRHALYENAFSNLILDWRKQWAQDDFPFYFVQLPDFQKESPVPGQRHPWSDLREAQRKTLKDPNTGMAVTIDIGEANELHPKNKRDVGERLALWALAKDYGRSNLVYSGPLYESVTFTKGKAIIKFSETGSGLMAAERLNAWSQLSPSSKALEKFEICGPDFKWVWAKAKIINHNTIEVSSPNVLQAIEVRYAWSINPRGVNLFNKEGLPASPFTTKE